MSTSPLRPSTARKDSQGSSRLPGSFDDDDQAQLSIDPGHHAETSRSEPAEHNDSSILPPLPQDSSILHDMSVGPGTTSPVGLDALNEREMRNRLMDVESSFLPEMSTFGQATGKGADDTFLWGAADKDFLSTARGGVESAEAAQPEGESEEQRVWRSPSPPTPPGAYRTPAVRQGGFAGAEEDEEAHVNTSSLETMSSSPTAAAAARTVQRVVSMATLGGYETADDRKSSRPSEDEREDSDDEESTPKKKKQAREMGDAPPPKLEIPYHDDGGESSDAVETKQPLKSGRRPKFLRSRQSSHRSSTSSIVTRSDFSLDTPSEIMGGADYALQSGGAMPRSVSVSSADPELVRTTSLGSIASGVTGISDNGNGWAGNRTVSGTSVLGPGRNLSTLIEEKENSVSSRTLLDEKESSISSRPTTPRVNSRTLTAPTDTVIAQHVRNIQVPASVAREYRLNNGAASPDKRSGMPTPVPGRERKNLTLKEQSSTIDRLTKENFDLKLKIHYLNNALNERSEEGVKEMISENVELKAGLVTLQKETRGLRRTIKELERKLAEKETKAPGDAETDDKHSSDDDDEEKQELLVEIEWLRERTETYEREIEKMRKEAVSREGEKRKLAEVVKSMGEKRGADGDIGVREEIDMWRDLHEAEVARREQADEDNRKLREEIARMKNDASSTTTNNYTSNVYNLKRNQPSRLRSRSRGSEAVNDRNNTLSSTASTLVDQLRHENAELRRDLGAQASMLTSRNREKERLYQEIEDLKLGLRRADGGRSVAGDSILERSASRAHERTQERSQSRGSGMARSTVTNDTEKEELEAKNAQLRDQLAEIKLTKQEMDRELDTLIDDMERLEQVKAELEQRCTTLDEDLAVAVEDLRTMQTERDEALTALEEREEEYETLKNEAQGMIDELETEAEQRTVQIERLETELENKIEDFNALQNEMRGLSNGVIRLEDDQSTNTRKIRDLQQDIEDANKVIEELRKTLTESNTKVERLTVQLESSQNEISFLREEQDGDKIKIGDLEDALKATEANLQDEKDRVKELEERIAEERHQRDVVMTQEKKEVQKVINELQQEVSTARDDASRLRKRLATKEAEAKESKERLSDLEGGLRDALGDISGTKTTFLQSIEKIQRELDSTVMELDSTKANLLEKERILRNRDTLLESTALESRRLGDLLERERQGRRADKYQFEAMERTHHQASRTLVVRDTRISELEQARSKDKKKLALLEDQFNNQLTERNNLLLALWNRLSTLCGSDWAHSNTLVNGKVPSLDVVANLLPSFSKNLLAAVRTIENMVGEFKARIRSIERDLTRQYQTLEHDLDTRSKRIESLESIVFKRRSSSTSTSSRDGLVKENRLLKAELAVLQKQLPDAPRSSGYSDSATSSPSKDPARRTSNVIATLSRPYSSMEIEKHAETHWDREEPTNPMDRKWILRLRDLENRLKEEREARVVDREGARRRLAERERYAEELRREMERERESRGD